MTLALLHYSGVLSLTLSLPLSTSPSLPEFMHSRKRIKLCDQTQWHSPGSVSSRHGLYLNRIKTHAVFLGHLTVVLELNEHLSNAMLIYRNVSQYWEIKHVMRGPSHLLWEQKSNIWFLIPLTLMDLGSNFYWHLVIEQQLALRADLRLRHECHLATF